MASFIDLTLDEMRASETKPTYRSLDEPILVFDRFTLAEVGVGLGATVLFGVILGDWLLMGASVAAALVGLPRIRGYFPRGTLPRLVASRFSHLPVGPVSWGRLTASQETVP